HLQSHDDGVDAGALPDADDEHDGDGDGDEDSGQIHDAARAHQPAHRRVVIEGRVAERLRDVDAHAADDVLEVLGPAVGDGHGGHGVFEYEVPTDDPGEELAQGGVGIGVGRARHR